jgi:ferredoxin, 2Fe-2S
LDEEQNQLITLMGKTAIHFTVYYDNEIHQIETYPYEYRNLMVLLYDKMYIEDFGECKGMGRCGTCLVRLKGLPEAIKMLDRNEETTLSKMGFQDDSIRLSCQLLVDEYLQNIRVEIIGPQS